MRFCKDRAILARYHPTAVVDSTLEQRVPWMEVILRFDVNDEFDGLTIIWYKSSEADVVEHRSFIFRLVFRLLVLDS